jgi:hypothetical protein
MKVVVARDVRLGCLKNRSAKNLLRNVKKKKRNNSETGVPFGDTGNTWRCCRLELENAKFPPVLDVLLEIQ